MSSKQQTTTLLDLHQQKLLVVGSRIEICDPSYIWSSALVVGVTENRGRGIHITGNRSRNDESQGISLTVRYDGWDPQWNEELPITSNRLAPIYTHTARLKCLVELFQKRKTKYEKQLSKSNLWPCILHIRMPCSTGQRKHTHSAEHELSDEPNVFVEPYRPDMLPIYIQNDWHYGGLWVASNRIQPFPEKMIQLQPTQSLKYSEIIYPDGFHTALLKANQDFSVPGYCKGDIFLKGSLVKKQYRVIHDGATAENYYELHKSGNNPLIDLSQWRNDLVPLEALENISDSHWGNGGNLHPRDKHSHKRKSEEFDPSDDCSDGLSYENQKFTKLESPLCSNLQIINTKDSWHSKSTKQDSVSAIVEPYLDSHVHDHDLGSTSAATRQPHKTGHISKLPNALKVTSSIYPGFDIFPSCCAPGKWIATAMFRGNEVQIGQFESQSEAKNEIDKYYTSSYKFNRHDSEVDIMDSSDDELDILRLRKIKTTEPVNINMNTKEQDINAISIDDAVSFAYQNGPLEDTGFSFYEWAKRVATERKT